MVSPWHVSLRLSERRLRVRTRVVRSRVALVAVVLALTPLLLAGITPPVAAAASSTAMLTEYAYNAAVDAFIADRSQASRGIDEARADIAAAQREWTDSASTLSDGAERAALGADIERALGWVDRAVFQLDRANRRIDFLNPVGGPVAARVGLAVQTAVLGSIRFEEAERLASLRQSLAVSERLVLDAVAARKAEHVRLAAFAAASAEAARVADEASVVAAAALRNLSMPSVAYAKAVWAVGWQREIDACRGAVDIGARYGVPVIAEHWSCGGSHFPRAGSTITLTGVVTGTFLIGQVAVVLDVDADSAASIPHGFDLLYQTCRNGSSATMSFTALTRIG